MPPCFPRDCWLKGDVRDVWLSILPGLDEASLQRTAEAVGAGSSSALRLAYHRGARLVLCPSCLHNGGSEAGGGGWCRRPPVSRQEVRCVDELVAPPV